MGVLDAFRLEGRAALVTGAAGGLGAAFAEALAEAGSDVACLDVREEPLQRTAQRVRSLGRRALALVADVSVEEQVRGAVKRAIEELGHLDVLFNNAGIAEAPQPLHRMSLEDWERVMAVNLRGAFLCAREVLRHMAERRRGKVVNVASIWGLVGSAAVVPVPAYVASKGAIVNLTRELALEYAPYNVQVNCLAPGFFRTGLGGGAYDDPRFVEQALQTVPLGRIGRPEELKAVAVFLASSASDLMTGHVLVVDGGYLAR